MTTLRSSGVEKKQDEYRDRDTSTVVLTDRFKLDGQNSKRKSRLKNGKHYGNHNGVIVNLNKSRKKGYGTRYRVMLRERA